MSHALEPGREYLLGSAVECDLRIPGAEPVHARLLVTPEGVTVFDLSQQAGLLHNEHKVPQAALRPGDRLAIAGELVVVTADDGTAALVPIPKLRQAALARRIHKVRAKAAAQRQEQERTFSYLMASELRRAPWMMVSLLLHLLLLLLFWLVTPEDKVGGRSVARLAFDVAAGAPAGEGPPAPPQVVAEPALDDILDDPEEMVEEAPPTAVDGPTPQPKQPTENPTLKRRQRPSTRGGGGDVVRDEKGIGGGSFEKQVRALQESGLEIVFVFDSTGSMTRTILDTKSSIVQMLDVLRTLVPDARVGLVTYRDRGRREEYLVREVPLDLDYWRATNFVQFVIAEGGGDRAEDVRAGLNSAFQQDWRTSARRVVVLAGDAPTHDEDFKKLLQEVQGFTANRRSFVHTLITSPERAGDDTKQQFEEIAKAGNGTCEPIENRDRILQRVLTLAFGAQFGDDLAAVIDNVEQERQRVDVRSLHLVRRGGNELRQALLQRPVPITLWNAVVKRPRRTTAGTLLDMLGDPNTPSHSRNAVAAALQKILELPVPPIDIDSNEAPPTYRVERLRLLAKQLPE